MLEKRLELAMQRGRLQQEIAQQRATLGQNLAPVVNLLGKGESTINGVRTVSRWVKRNPLPIFAAATMFALAKPVRVWRWGKRSLALWRGWKAVKNKVALFL